ncbi:ABC transporter ATP-binding protein [Absiella sp. AM29-15]|uniref:ABC transporter ATP-binding protein n=1 Tax=Absiella sp. AM29-15 TaxID=2292278 RepID=UPI000E401523|nr:ABC transporter ATP-binding protein [Absiella sp. AM29-15]RGC51988.1 ABC transporter ATP-binding protein [Absiella sp. AM29-15]
MEILQLQDVSYTYTGKTNVIEHVSLSFKQGKIYAIVGKSGAGKTTLLSMMSLLTKPSSGKILYDAKDITDMDPYHYRSQYVGVIFQNYNLLMHLTALENVVLSMEIAGKKENRKMIARELLEKVGLDEEEMNRRILKLSGGQQQRVAIARCLSYEPKVILADEPTGNLDMETQAEILEIFKSLAKEGHCIIMVTHSKEVAACADEIYELKRMKKSTKKI